jgi:hypothetical protein
VRLQGLLVLLLQGRLLCRRQWRRFRLQPVTCDQQEPMADECRPAGRPHGDRPGFFLLSSRPMTMPPCPICRGETFEIRAKLVCRLCGTILETCCEGGPMGPGGSCRQPAAPPEQPDQSVDFSAG